MKKYNIKYGYEHRKDYSYFNDMPFTDGWQNEVYQEAIELAEKTEGINFVADVGCGSAFKLLKYFNSDAYDISGYDVEETVRALKAKHPEYPWHISDFDEEPYEEADMVICSDVIEHVLDPDDLCNFLKKFKAKKYVISTPDRDLVYGGHDHNGPPNNPTHIREWNFSEFRDYISSHFQIERHWISNRRQATQAIICNTK